MATNTKQASKPTKSAKPAAKPKKAAPVVKATTNKNIAKAPAAVKTATKKAPIKAAKTNTATHNSKTVNKKNSTPAAPAKKAIAAKKAAEPAKKVAEPVKKAVVVKKAAEPVKKVVAVKPAAKAAPAPAPAPAKAVTKPVVAKAAPAPAPAKKSSSKAPVKKVITVSQLASRTASSAPRPTATPAARSTERKPNVIIAHRKLENKSRQAEQPVPEYNAESYRSILDEAPVVLQGPVYRYSDEDLVEFRELITSRLDAARKELNYLQGLITRKDEAGTEDTENRYMNMEDGSGAMEREQLAQMASRQIQFMGNLEKAMVRIENKTYGICRVTGKLIDKARLRAVPHATLSIEAKKAMAGKSGQ